MIILEMEFLFSPVTSLLTIRLKALVNKKIDYLNLHKEDI
tara:strand:+ start:3898 stop:4017 length:120 start_codon:yes stop_codon:yes gene_type:complete